MSALEINISRLQVPMKQSFKHASADRKVTDSLWASVSRSGLHGMGEGCPRPYVTGETSEGGLAWLQAISREVAQNAFSLETLQAWVKANSAAIDANPAAWCALELAILDLLAREKNVSVESLLGLEKLQGAFRYTAVLGDDSPAKLQAMLSRYLETGFTDFKLKISGDPAIDREKLRLMRQASEAMPGKLRVRIDANNFWAGKLSEAAGFLASSPLPLFAVEEPLAPRDHEGLSALSQELGLNIILDESLTRISDVKRFASLPGKWIGNVRVSKMGGLLRSLDVLREMKRSGMQAIIGAQVGETSVLTRAALTIAREAGDMLLAQEGAFGTLLIEKDAADPVLMFGAGGVLKWPATGSETGGWGLRPSLN